MTIYELFTAVGEITPDKPYQVSVEIWQHRHAGNHPKPEAQFRIWDGNHFYSGPTPEAALAAMRAAYAAPVALADIEVGEPA
jgi:hypothetical protein